MIVFVGFVVGNKIKSNKEKHIGKENILTTLVSERQQKGQKNIAELKNQPANKDFVTEENQTKLPFNQVQRHKSFNAR